ncbi:unnamed protein product, partial [Closterium sp. NIES-53]
QNGIAERRIGMVMDVARTSMIHAAAPHFLWPFAVQYAVHQINLEPRVSLPETTPTLRWTGKVGDATAFRVWGSRAFVRDTTADKLSSRADVTFDESVSYYRLFPYCTASLPPPPLFLAPDPAEPVEVAVGSGATRGAEPAGAGAGGAGTGGAEPERVEPEGAESGGAESRGAEPGRVEPEGTVSGGAEPARAASGGALGVPLRRQPLSPQQLREWYSWRCRGAAGAAAAGAAGGAAGAAGGAACAGGAAGASGGTAGAGAAGGAAGAGGATGAGATGGAVGAGAAGGAAGAGVAEAAGGTARAAGGAAGTGGAADAAAAGAAGGAAETGDHGAEGTGPISAVLGSPPSPGPPPPFLSPPPVQSQSQLQPASPLPGPSPYSGPTSGLTERRERESCPASSESRSESPIRAVRTSRHVPRPRPPPVPSTHSMTLRPSTAPQRVPLPSPPASSLPAGPDPASESLRAASPAVTRFLATAVTDPLFESTAASSLVTELVDFAAACRLDHTTSLVAESASVSVCPPSLGGECALGTDVLEDRQEEFECFAASVPHLVSMLIASMGDPDAPDIPTPCSYAEAIEGPYSSWWQAAMDAEMASWKSTGTYGVDFFQTFSPTPKMTTLRVLLHVAAQRDYELHSLDFRTAFLQGSLHEEIWLRRPPGFTGSFLAGTQWSLRRPVYGLRKAPHDLVFATADTEALAHVKSELRKIHTCTDLGELTSYLGLRITRDRAQRTITLTQSHMVQQVLQRFVFTYSSPQSTPLPTGLSLSAPPSDESVEPSGPYPELVGCLMYLITCT